MEACSCPGIYRIGVRPKAEGAIGTGREPNEEAEVTVDGVLAHYGMPAISVRRARLCRTGTAKANVKPIHR